MTNSQTITSTQAMIDLGWNLTLAVFAVFVVMSLPQFAYAGGAIGKVLCAITDWFTGPVGKAVATIAIVVVGLGALMGKIQWGMALIVGVGIALIFGASTIVNELGTAAGAPGEGCDSL